MKMKSVVLLVVAVGCGLVAMLGVQQVLSGKKAEEVKAGKVLVATAQIIAGTPLNAENTMFKELPLELIPKGAVTDPKQYAEKSLRSSAVPGEFIMLAKLTSELGASSEIPKGMRVVTTSVNLTKTHSGLIRPGDRVDILLSYKARNPERGMIAKTQTILEFIEVFATDSVMSNEEQTIEGAEIHAKNLSFLVTLEQATILKLAESKGELHLALRNKHDEEFVNGPAVTEAILNDGGSSLFAEVTEGSESERQMFPEGGGDVRAAIASEIAEPEPQSEQVAVVEPAIPTWKVTVYAGKEVLEQEVPMPLGENGMTKEEAALAEREAALAEWEAELNAREAEMGPKNQDQPAADAAAGSSDADAAPESADQSNEPAADANGKKQWKKVLKGLLIGA